ncbi:MAG: hypothetical protein WC975_04940 [Phycisphaerae bacterium]
MFKHRIAFMGVWMAFTIALFAFPGFEVRGLAMGMIIGYWPAVISERISGSQHYHPIIFLLMMIILSGTTVGLLAWLIDKAQMTKRIWILLGVSIVISGAVLSNIGLSYEEWKMRPEVSQAMESPEANYQPNRGEFNIKFLIPRTLVGGLWGLYGVTGLCALFSVAILLKKKYIISPGKPDAAG